MGSLTQSRQGISLHNISYANRTGDLIAIDSQAGYHQESGRAAVTATVSRVLVLAHFPSEVRHELHER
jgi:hypothetical protein